MRKGLLLLTAVAIGLAPALSWAQNLPETFPQQSPRNIPATTGNPGPIPPGGAAPTGVFGHFIGDGGVVVGGLVGLGVLGLAFLALTTSSENTGNSTSSATATSTR